MSIPKPRHGAATSAALKNVKGAQPMMGQRGSSTVQSYGTIIRLPIGLEERVCEKWLVFSIVCWRIR